MKRMISALLCLALLLSISPIFGVNATTTATGTAWDGRTSEDFAGGSGTAEDPFQIANGAQLYQLALNASDSTMASDVYTATKDTCYVLTANIDMGNKIFPGIAYFSGTLDGCGYRIYNLNIKNTATSYTGLVRKGAKCTLRNLTVEGTISGSSCTGGIVGSLTSGSTLAKCTNYCTISGSSYTGGICGYSAADITGCRNMGTVSGSSDVGGIVGYTSALVTSCVNTGAVTGSSDYVGGIVGYCINYNSTYSSLCVNIGEVKGHRYVAGICGYIDYGYFENCYNTGSITATYSDAVSCGIAFRTSNAENKKDVRRCYNTGALIGGSKRYGVSSFCGSYCYYLSGTASSSGYDSSCCAIKLTAEEMASAGAFVGFDFVNVWTWDNSGAYDYPILKDIGLVLTPCSDDAHQWDEGAVATAATCTSTGSLLLTCVKCKETTSLDIAPLGHALTELPAIPATCTESGLTAGSRCTRCDGATVEQQVIPAYGHDYKTVITPPTCADDGYTTYTCSVCNHSYTDNSVDAIGHNWDKGTQTAQPNCTEKGSVVYTCLTCSETKVESIPENGHSYNTIVTPPTCTEGGYTTFICSVCNHSYIGDRKDATGHNWNNGIVTVNPGCEADGKKVYTCLTCGETRDEALTATGHNYIVKVTKPTCTEVGYTTHTCSACGDSYKDTYVGATGHAWNQGVEMTKATCTTSGEKIYTCGNCGETKSEAVAPLGHSYNAKVTAPTCTEAGYTTYTCSACGDTYTGDTVAATGHNYSEKVTVPTCTEAGFTTCTCTECGHSYAANAVPATGHSFNKGNCTLCNAEDPDYVISNPFVDVKEGDYFYDPVLWAVKEGITTGTSATTFGPEKPCTRGQVVTFLWRACGSPEPTKADNPFSDVSESAYYYKAVLWAVEQGITTGVSKTSFGPDKTCTRGQVATFLWRAQGKPTPTTTTNPFTDIAQADYYYSAVLWAVEEGVTNGTGKGLFSPDKDCTRGQIVTFLYRALS